MSDLTKAICDDCARSGIKPPHGPCRHMKPKPAAGPWVSVEERLPERDEWVLIQYIEDDKPVLDFGPYDEDVFEECGIVNWASVNLPEVEVPRA